jgi:hypothetical protein
MPCSPRGAYPWSTAKKLAAALIRDESGPNYGRDAIAQAMSNAVLFPACEHMGFKLRRDPKGAGFVMCGEYERGGISRKYRS